MQQSQNAITLLHLNSAALARLASLSVPQGACHRSALWSIASTCLPSPLARSLARSPAQLPNDRSVMS
jgi:hypothetical protein